MLRVAYYDSQRELLVAGCRDDYEHLCDVVRQSLVSGSELAISVRSTGETLITHLMVRRSTPPNRVSYQRGLIVLEIAPSLQDEFLSFVEFPSDADLPDSPIQYHHHYDGFADDGNYVALDSLPVVFSLERT